MRVDKYRAVLLTLAVVLFGSIFTFSSCDQNQEKLNEELFLASQGGEQERVKDLISSGADVTANDYYDYGVTPLFWPCADGHVDIVRLLLDAGADPNVRDRDGNTPLHWAAGMGNAETVELLLKYGANPNIIGLYNRTPARLALEKGFDSLADLLEKAETPD